MRILGRTEPVTRPGNRFDRLEWAGAFGDLGTLVPFVVAYIAAPRPVVVGIVLGLEISFMLEGIKLMQGGWLIATLGLLGGLLLLTNRSIPAMFLLLLFGVLCGAIENPEPLRTLITIKPEFRLPGFGLLGLTWHDLLIGTTLLALPQLPLTLGNAVIAIHEENNRLFPDRAVTENTIAYSTGVMNLTGAVLGGVPMCHGAGGMAGHVAFGARTGGAPIILGSILLCLALFFSASIHALFDVFARPVLGVILFLTGAQLALGSCDFSKNKGERFITLTTTAFAMWNVGLAFLVGLALAYLEKRGRLRL